MAKLIGKSSDAKMAVRPTERLDELERIAKILSLIAIPVVIAIVGWFVQGSLADRNVGEEYVKLAVSILNEPKDKDKGEPLLRSWAADLLDQNSPTKFSREALQALKEGQVTLPTQLAKILGATGAGGSLAVSPDGKLIAIGQDDGTARLFDAASTRIVAIVRGHSDAVTSLAFSPDVPSVWKYRTRLLVTNSRALRATRTTLIQGVFDTAA